MSRCAAVRGKLGTPTDQGAAMWDLIIIGYDDPQQARKGYDQILDLRGVLRTALTGADERELADAIAGTNQ
jgi:hypothetical protein